MRLKNKHHDLVSTVSDVLVFGSKHLCSVSFFDRLLEYVEMPYKNAPKKEELETT